MRVQRPKRNPLLRLESRTRISTKSGLTGTSNDSAAATCLLVGSSGQTKIGLGARKKKEANAEQAKNRAIWY
jgi:hypothetical protein